MKVEFERLKEAGLIVKENKGRKIKKLKIFKPASIPGNSRQERGFPISYESQRILCSAPKSMIFQQGDSWFFTVWLWAPGPGPGDFNDKYSSVSEVVDAVLDYYFGDPSKMNPPELLEYYRDTKIDI
ncbi:MAG: hypothetical protein F6J87_08385 [Spirulina sp. SIO3F2]|nr:hypothetical protein [Spirulina sp. SIO3F2]